MTSAPREGRWAWPALVGSGVLEAVWATAMGASAGFTRPGATTVFAIALVMSVLGLGSAMRHIPTGTAYAVWTAIGSVLTVSWGIVQGTQPAQPLTVVFLAGIIGCVLGLHALENREARHRHRAGGVPDPLVPPAPGD
ncbi:quaternary ammonium compound-resistance protein SugE [Raineyella antarctica]|uniref:Quaternary ammonium compound-resistance protein SugE n=1 Tax=Raineyella antarctica TaxID=1577474 RepID=A0A1G6H7T8_9ACTN|nr:multidrug efflux SMR transporter [Raineyella antarctica]SDB90322.1 quaternary ammonium compound-resistance protein SugE [Raineyella antarctica]